jgi:hypothetical protein
MKSGKYFIVVLLTVIAFTMPSFAAQQKTPAPIEGVYSNLSYSSETGDAEGLRIVILNSGDNYFVVAQCAEGGVPEPVLVPASVKGRSIRFTLPEGKFEGAITEKGLQLHVSFSSAHKNKPLLVKRLLKF